MRSFSIKRQIVAAVVCTELALVVCLLLLTISVMRSHAIRSFDTALRGRALSVAALVRYSEGTHPDLLFDSAHLPREVTEGHPDMFHIETQDGHVLASAGSFDSLISSEKTQPWDFVTRGIHYRGVTLLDVPILDSEEDAPEVPLNLKIEYASSTEEMRANLNRAFLSIFVGGLFLLAISVYVSVHAIEKGLFPLSQLADRAGAISSKNWGFAVPQSAAGVKEIAPLASSLSEMVDRLHVAFQQQRDFTSNAAHELRTPVTILKSTLQSLLQEPRSVDIYRSGISDALSDLSRLEMLLHSMLRLARADQNADNRLPLEHSRIDVIGTCETAIARLSTLAMTHRATVSLIAPSEPMHVRAEPEDLEIVWANLIENAIRHGQPEPEVKVIAERQNGSVSVSVIDKGKGISPSDLPKLFDRFYRGDQSRSRESGGYGLGLAIAKAFVEGYGGSIRATSAETHGTRISVELPISD
jgi:signal transduction histidine kinase